MLPEQWTEALFEEITPSDAPIIYGILQPGPDLVDGVPYVRPTEVNDGRIDLSTIRRTSMEIADRYKRSTLRNGDIILSIVGTIGKVAEVPAELDGGNITQSSCRIRSDDALAGRAFLKYFLKSPTAIKQYDEKRLGTAVPRLNIADIRRFVVPLPPLAEQRRIVAKLDALTACLACARAELERVDALVESQRQIALASAFQGNLTADLRSSSAEELNKLPTGWRLVTVESLASDAPRAIQSGPFGSSLLHSEFQDSGRLVIGIDNVQDGYFSLGASHRISSEKYAELEKFRARGEDVVITVMATIGRTCVIPIDIEPAIITKHVYRITVDQAQVSPHYLMNALRGSEYVLEQMGANVRGHTRPGINGSILKQLLIPLAPVPEQFEISKRLDSIFARADRLEVEVTRARALLDRLEDSILTKAFRGELVPQDPADEPTSILLERIRTERAISPTLKRKRIPKAQAASGI